MIKFAMISTQFVVIQDLHTWGFLPRTEMLTAPGTQTHLKQEKGSSLYNMMFECNCCLLLSSSPAGLRCLPPRRLASLPLCSYGANNATRHPRLKSQQQEGCWGRAAGVNVLVKFFTTLFGEKIWVLHATATAQRPPGKRGGEVLR